MKQQIYDSLNQARNLHVNLQPYLHRLPQNLRDGSNTTYTADIPNRLNVILTLINISLANVTYLPVSTVAEAMVLFSTENNLQEHLEHLHNIGNMGVQENGDIITGEQILARATSQLNQGVQMLGSYAMVAMLPPL